MITLCKEVGKEKIPGTKEAFNLAEKRIGEN